MKRNLKVWTVVKKIVVPMVIALVFVAGVLYGLYRLAGGVWGVFKDLPPTVGVGIIAATATILVSVMSVLVAKYIEQRNLIIKEIRDKKVPVYEDFVDFILSMVFASKLERPALEGVQLMERMFKFNKEFIIWGSEDLVREYYSFRKKSLKGDAEGMVWQMESLFLAIRKDLGHPNKGLEKGMIMGLFINDLEQMVDSAPNERETVEVGGTDILALSEQKNSEQ